jgi:hypothetical protein
MKLFNNMEVVLMFAFGTLCAIVAVRPGVHANTRANMVAAVAADAGRVPSVRIDPRVAMPVVHVIGKRLTAAEKREDARAGSAG